MATKDLRSNGNPEILRLAALARAIDIAFVTVGVFTLAITTVSAIVAIPVPAALSTVLNTINNTGVVWSAYRAYTGAIDAWVNYIEGE